jgi:diguanylate cyclase (GGDEF)-like protein
MIAKQIIDAPERLLRTVQTNALICVTVCALLTICTLFIIVLVDERTQAFKEASSSASHVASMLSREIDHNINLVDMTLSAVIVWSNDDAVRQAEPRLRHNILFARAGTTKDLRSILLLDHEGNIVADSRSEYPDHDNLVFQDYFKVHAANPRVGLYIGDPYIEDRSGISMIGISRRLNDPTERFDGVVVGMLPLSYFTNLFQEFHVKGDSATGIFRRDGALIAAEPTQDGPTGAKSRTADLSTRFKDRTEGVYVGASPLGGAPSLIRFQQIGARPIVQLVSVPLSDVYRAWERKAAMSSVALLIVSLFIVGMAAALQRELRRRAAVEAALAKAAKTDVLTMLPNRRALDEVLEKEWSRCSRSGRPLSAIMIDVDFFKTYNDKLGHRAGDRILSKIASAIADCVSRPQDFAARYGGEEFVVLLPETNACGALSVAERVCRSVYDLEVPHLASPFERMTVSLGVASLTPTLALETGALLDRADRALYASKANGRNRVTMENDESRFLGAAA